MNLLASPENVNLFDELQKCATKARRNSCLEAEIFDQIVVPKIQELVLRYSDRDIGIAKTLKALDAHIDLARKQLELFQVSEPSESVISWLYAGFDAQSIARAFLDLHRNPSTDPVLEFLSKFERSLHQFVDVASASKMELIKHHTCGRNSKVARVAFLLELALLLHRDAGVEISTHTEGSLGEIGIVCIQHIENLKDSPDISNALKASVKQFRTLTNYGAK